jgi:putative phosphoesterase
LKIAAPRSGQSARTQRFHSVNRCITELAFRKSEYTLAIGHITRAGLPLIEADMRILLLADIHANWPALQAIQEPFDVCLVLGDLVDYGLEAGPCIEWVRQQATQTIRGNHDHGVAQHVRVNGRTGYKYLTGVTRLLTQERLRPQDRRFLGAMPITKRLTLDNTKFLLVHATPRDPLDEYAIADADFWSRRLQDVDAQVICVGHTHHPYVLEVGDKLIVNPGSVGQPRDGDPRASYAIIEDQRVELKRIEYPVEDTVRTVLESNLPEPAKALLVEVFRTGALAKPDSGKQKTDHSVPPSDVARSTDEAASS